MVVLSCSMTAFNLLWASCLLAFLFFEDLLDHDAHVVQGLGPLHLLTQFGYGGSFLGYLLQAVDGAAAS